jgi:DNA repair protein RadA/Sms
MILAVLQRRAGASIGRQDVYAATVGGVRLTEPSVDLAVALAVASAAADLSIPRTVVAIGEVGLAGEIRRVPGMSRRLAEAERMGFRCAIVPPGSGGLPAGPATASRRSRAARNGTARDGTARDGDPAAGPLTDIREASDLRTAIAAALG